MDIDPKKASFGSPFEARGTRNASIKFDGIQPPQSQNPQNPSQSFGNNPYLSSNSGIVLDDPNELTSAKKLFDISLDMFKERLGKFLALISVVVIVGLIMDLVISLPLAMIFNPDTIEKYDIVNVFLISLVSSIIISIPSIILSISIIETIKDGNLDVKVALSKSWGKFKDYFSTQIVGALMFSGVILLIPASFVIQLIVRGGAMDSVNPILTILVFAAVIPVIYVIEIWIFIALLGVILEGLKTFEAFSYGYELIRGKVSKTFWRMIGLSWRMIIYVLIIRIIVGAATGIPAGMVLTLSGNDPSVSKLLSFALSYVDIALNLFFTSFALVYQYNIYENLKTLKKDMPQDYKMRHQGMIKTITLLGVVLVGLALAALVYYAPAVDSFVKKGIQTARENDDMSKLNLNNPDPKDAEAIRKGIDIRTREPQLSEEELVEKRDKQRKDDLGNISIMIYNYKYVKGFFPLSPSLSKLNEENSVVGALKSVNSEPIPLDPKNPEYYYGYTSADGNNFELSARLENLNDPFCEANIKSVCLYRLKF